jgi:hypothetical protein
MPRALLIPSKVGDQRNIEPAFFNPCAAAPEIGAYSVKTKTAVLIGDGTGRISFASPQQYSFEAQRFEKC